jgi:hypothetical protein
MLPSQFLRTPDIKMTAPIIPSSPPKRQKCKPLIRNTFQFPPPARPTEYLRIYPYQSFRAERQKLPLPAHKRAAIS